MRDLLSPLGMARLAEDMRDVDAEMAHLAERLSGFAVMVTCPANYRVPEGFTCAACPRFNECPALPGKEG